MVSWGVAASIGPKVSATFLGVVFLFVYLVLPIWAIVSVIRSLHGSLRIFWVVAIIVSWLFVPLIGLILAVMWFAFKKRFVNYQRS